ncbi:MAG: hypothetical protein H6711_16410 [Myxococcales bacterium]|nr:hypothetical protein [Myxococcales bacterium]
MPALVLLAWLAVVIAVARRWRRAEPSAPRIDAAVITGALTLTIAGLITSLLGVVGRFDHASLALAGVLTAALLWPWRRRATATTEAAPPGSAALPKRAALALALALGGGLALRAPLHSAELAGRDQGTYVLRARHLLARGEHDLRDPVLAAAGAAAPRPGPGDLVGLYPTDGDPWRRGVYEGAYRPGLYLRERSSGAVVPQFLHMHPSLLAAFGALAGPRAFAGVLYLYAALALLGIAALARRLWPAWGWAPPLAATLLAVHPLAIWVGRTPLTEPLALLLGIAALLVVVGARPRPALAALFLGALAWIRGNAWLGAPLLLAILWLRGSGERRDRAPALYLGLLLSSLLLHAFTVFPYLFDELGRQLGRLFPVRPATLSALGIGGAILWWAIDRGLVGRLADARLAALRRRLPRALAALAGVAIIAWLALGGLHPERPFSRLDHAPAGLGAVLLAIAGLGLVRLVRRPPTPTSAWALAIASLPVSALLLYAQRNLPQSGLFYFGRYLVPELLPAALLLALHGLAGLRERRPRLAGAAALALVAAIAWPLVHTPEIRLAEHAGTERLVDAVAEALPPGAIVVAGGEGWHSAHTFNQVGGALVLAHGIAVVPYRSAETTYAALHELLLDGPAARGEAPPPLFLLIGEASHAYTRADGVILASIDDALPPPFRARPIGLYELYSDRLTPKLDALPTAGTRSALRLGLFAVEVDPEARARVQRLRADAGGLGDPKSGVSLSMSGETWNEGHLCLRADEDLTIELPPLAPGAAIVLVGEAGAGAQTPRWTAALDERALDLAPPPQARERDTLGPFVVAAPPRRLTLRGAAEPLAGAACPHGALTELRLLPPPRPADGVPPLARAWDPPDDHGHPPKHASWVRGRSLSRLRPEITPPPELAGLSLVLRPEAPLRFAPIALPPGPGAWIAHLTKIEGGAAGLMITIDGAPLPTIELPGDRPGSWQAPPIPWVAGQAPVTVEVALVGPPGAAVALRDLAFFGDAVIAEPHLDATATP